MNEKNVILTGVPRSGTTLACLLLSKLSDGVALNEPMRTAAYQTRAEALAAVPAFFTSTRSSILERGVATARAVGGKMTDNHFAEVKGKRTKLVTKQEIRIEKPLTSSFRLAIKHNALFTILQDDLLRKYPVFAFVRNPLAVLASWNSLDLPVSRGEVRALDLLLPDKAAELRRQGSLAERQLYILNWYFERYRTLPAGAVIKYEDIVASGGRALSAIDPAAAGLDEDLSGRNRSKVYDWTTIGPLAKRLLASDNACWSFYERAEVENLLRIA